MLYALRYHEAEVGDGRTHDRRAEEECRYIRDKQRAARRRLESAARTPPYAPRYARLPAAVLVLLLPFRRRTSTILSTQAAGMLCLVSCLRQQPLYYAACSYVRPRTNLKSRVAARRPRWMARWTRPDEQESELAAAFRILILSTVDAIVFFLLIFRVFYQ